MNAREIAAARLRAAAEYIPEEAKWTIASLHTVAIRLEEEESERTAAMAAALLGGAPDIEWAVQCDCGCCDFKYAAENEAGARTVAQTWPCSPTLLRREVGPWIPADGGRLAGKEEGERAEASSGAATCLSPSSPPWPPTFFGAGAGTASSSAGEPQHEVECPSCGATIRARMADAPGTPTQPRSHNEETK